MHHSSLSRITSITHRPFQTGGQEFVLALPSSLFRPHRPEYSAGFLAPSRRFLDRNAVVWETLFDRQAGAWKQSPQVERVVFRFDPTMSMIQTQFLITKQPLSETEFAYARC